MSARARAVGEKSLVGFFVGDIHYAVEIAEVVQITQPGPIEPLPHLPPSVLGVSDYRGTIIPVVDLRVRFGLPGSGSPRQKWIIVRSAQRPCALVVDSVTDVVGRSGEDLLPAPRVGEGDDVRGILGIVHVRGKMTFVLELATLRSVLDLVPSATPQAPPQQRTGARS